MGDRWRGRDGKKVIAQETNGIDHINTEDLFIHMLQSISKMRKNLVIEYLSIVWKIGIKTFLIVSKNKYKAYCK